MSSSFTPFFRWIHISGIHFARGKPILVDALKVSIKEQSKKLQGNIDAILVTGDISFSGQLDEYRSASETLEAIASVVNLSCKNIFLVPGNHDVQRDYTDNDTKRLLTFLFKGEETLDDLSGSDLEKLRKRFENYLVFTKQFAAASNSLFWHHKIEKEVTIRLAGFNTALLCQGDTDKGRLQLGKKQIEDCLIRDKVEDEIIILMSHHPLDAIDNGYWLRDSAEILPVVKQYVHLHLFGHIDSLNIRRFIPGNKQEFVSMTTGKLDKYKYNIGELAYNREGEVFLRAWPLFYSSQNGDFRPDIESVSGDQYFFEVPLNKQIRLPKIEERINNTIPNANNLAEASSLSLEGDSYKEKGKYKEAEECYKKALELREKIDHPDAALSLNSLGEIYYSQNNLTDAKAFLERALQICRGKLDLLFTATVLNNLANVRISQAEARVSKNGPFMKLALQQIEPLYIEALKIREQKLGKEHLDTALSLNNLALLYSKQGYLEKAEPLFKKALEIFEKSLGSEDVTTKLVKANYRDMLVKKSKP